MVGRVVGRTGTAIRRICHSSAARKYAGLFAFLIILICFNSKFAAIGGIANVAQDCPASRYIKFGYLGGYFS
jgi:hypothetical protein